MTAMGKRHAKHVGERDTMATLAREARTAAEPFTNALARALKAAVDAGADGDELEAIVDEQITTVERRLGCIFTPAAVRVVTNEIRASFRSQIAPPSAARH